MLVARQRTDRASDEFRFFRFGRGDHDAELLPRNVFGEKIFFLPHFIFADDHIGGRKDVLGGAVVFFKHHDLRVGILFFKIEDVCHIRLPPPVDRLVKVAHRADVAIFCGEQVHKTVLGEVGILVFVDENIPELFLIVLKICCYALQKAVRRA